MAKVYSYNKRKIKLYLIFTILITGALGYSLFFLLTGDLPRVLNLWIIKGILIGLLFSIILIVFYDILFYIFSLIDNTSLTLENNTLKFGASYGNLILHLSEIEKVELVLKGQLPSIKLSILDMKEVQKRNRNFMTILVLFVCKHFHRCDTAIPAYLLNEDSEVLLNDIINHK